MNPRDNVVGERGKEKEKARGKEKERFQRATRSGRNEFRELISAPRMHRNRTHRTGTNIVVPDSGRARATVGDFSRSFFRGDAREVRKEEEQKKKEEEEKDPLLRRARALFFRKELLQQRSTISQARYRDRL